MFFVMPKQHREINEASEQETVNKIFSEMYFKDKKKLSLL